MRQKIVSRSNLAGILNRQPKKKIVFTNGCFDLLHVGHIQLLEKAKKLGDYLVVAVNSDRSLKRLKGSHRPLVKEKYRARILAALSCVDYVTIFSEPTPAETIDCLRPDILVKGNDYRTSEIVGRDQVKKVVRISLVKNCSTSGLIEKILRSYGCKKSKTL